MIIRSLPVPEIIGISLSCQAVNLLHKATNVANWFGGTDFNNGEGMIKLGFADIAVSVMTVSTVDGVIYYDIRRWRLSSLSSLTFTLF